MGVVLGESRGTQPCVFSGPVAAAGDERYLVCAAGAAAVEPVRNRFLLCVLQMAMSGCSCVRRSLPFFNLCLQIAGEWLHDCCHILLPCAQREVRIGDVMLEDALLWLHKGALVVWLRAY